DLTGAGPPRDPGLGDPDPPDPAPDDLGPDPDLGPDDPGREGPGLGGHSGADWSGGDCCPRPASRGRPWSVRGAELLRCGSSGGGRRFGWAVGGHRGALGAASRVAFSGTRVGRAALSARWGG